jgi:hypothetical protein
MSARNRGLAIERLARLATVVGLAVWCAAALAPATAWGGCGGGGGGGAKTPPPAAQKNDPAKVKQLRDLTKRLKAEMHLDNQKSYDVRVKEAAQSDEMVGLLGQLPDQTDPALKDAQNAINDFQQQVLFNPKYH